MGLRTSRLHSLRKSRLRLRGVLIFSGLFLGILLGGNSASSAQNAAPPTVDCMDDPACVELVKSARRLSEAAQLNASLTTYQSAFERWRSPWLLINIGRIQQKMGRPEDAIASFKRYLDSATNDTPERIDAARGYLKQAETDLADKRAREAAATRSAAAAKPVYKKWWFWVAIGGAAVAASAITVGVVLGTRSADERDIPMRTAMFTF